MNASDEFQRFAFPKCYSEELTVPMRFPQTTLNYEIKDVTIDDSGNSATVTFTSKKLHSLGLASAVRTVLTEPIGDAL